MWILVKGVFGGAVNLAKMKEVYCCGVKVANWLHTVLLYSGVRNNFNDYSFKTRTGRFLRVDDRDELTTVWHVFFGDEYTVSSKCRTVLDIGANIGAFAVWVTEVCPDAKVWSVEPFPGTFERLLENVEKNHLTNRVECLSYAIAAKDGWVSFDATQNRRSYCRGILSEQDSSPSVKVMSLTLASLLAKIGVEQVDCLKMDVEGAEYEILLNTPKQVLQRVSIVTLEYHDESKAAPLFEHMQACGFCCRRRIRNGWSGLATFEQI